MASAWRSQSRSFHWVFLGCPGVGKGTYAGRLSNLLGVPHIATGDLVRQELSSSGPLSQQLALVVNQGKLLSDEIIFSLLAKRLEAREANNESGFILDGFPRTIRQAGEERLLEHCGAWTHIVPMYKGLCGDCWHHSGGNKKSGVYLAVRADLFHALVDKKQPHHSMLFFKMFPDCYKEFKPRNLFFEDMVDMWLWLKVEHPNYDMPRIFDGFIDQLVMHPVTVSDIEREEETSDEDAETGDEAKPILIESDNDLAFLFCLYWEILEDVTDINLAINLKLREDVIIEKCLGRRICSQCGGNFNVASIDIKGENGCRGMYMAPLLPPPSCETKLITRPDDTEEVVKERLRIYNEMSQPVEEFYRRRGKLLEFDLPGGIPESWPKLLRALNLDDLENKQSATA